MPTRTSAFPEKRSRPFRILDRLQATIIDMALHNWAELNGWEGAHLLWMTELLRHIKSELPSGYRAYLGSGPAVAIGAPTARPDVSIRSQAPSTAVAAVASHLPENGWAEMKPDVEVAVASLELDPALLIERDGRLIAAIELISPRNKDRPVARTAYAFRYAGYLLEGVHLLLVDVHPRPAGFSFADQIALQLSIPNQPALPPAMAVSYRVGEPAATGGRFLAIWRYPLTIGGLLPTVRLPLTIDLSVPVDLDSTYGRAAADAYLP